MSDKTDGYYVINENFQKLLIDYYVSDNNSVLADAIAKRLQSIATRLCESGKFRNYPPEQKQEMIQEAVCKMFMKLKEYDYQQYSNPFSFFTSITYNAFRLHLKKAKKHKEETTSLENLDMNPSMVMGDYKFRDRYDTRLTQNV